jgi:hypothetical protein
VGGQRADLAGALAQRRQLDGQDRQPVVEVAPERALGRHGLQIPVGRGHHPDVHLHRLGPAHALDHPLLEYP